VPPVTRVRLELATSEDAPAVAALRTAVADHMTAVHGRGYWSSRTSERMVLFHMRRARVFVAREGQAPIATLTLGTRKPWAIDRKYFTPCPRPLYLTEMAVAPGWQRRGVGRGCILEATRIGREWPGDAIWLDAFDAEAGAGEFYRRCGFREVGRASYRGVPLIYFEMAL
jgi:ribosomal protein S18 acetylase RimI-like enzyme